MIFQNTVNLTKREQSFIDWVTGPQCPWFCVPSTSEKFMYFVHPLMERNKDKCDAPGCIVEPFKNNYDICYGIFKRFCDENNIIVNKVLRAALNNTYYHPQAMADLHMDHPFYHKNFVMYLNEFDNGYTYIFSGNHNDPDDADHKLIGTIIPKKNEAVVFNDSRHAQGFCAPNQNRYVLVFTFN